METIDQSILERLNNLTPANEFEGVSVVQNGIEYFKDPTGTILARPINAKPTDTVSVFNSQGDLVNSYVEGQQRSWISEFNPIVGKVLPAVAATLALGPAGSGLLGGTGAAAAGSALGNLASGGDLESALRAAALGGLTAYGISEFVNPMLQQGAYDQAFAAADAANMANAGLDANTIAANLQTYVDPATATSLANSAATQAGSLAYANQLVAQGFTPTEIATALTDLGVSNTVAQSAASAAADGITQIAAQDLVSNITYQPQVRNPVQASPGAIEVTGTTVQPGLLNVAAPATTGLLGAQTFPVPSQTVQIQPTAPIETPSAEVTAGLAGAAAPTGAGTGGVAGQTVNVLGNTDVTGLGTAGAGLLGSVVGTGLAGTGTGAGTSTTSTNTNNDQTVNVAGSTLGGTTGSTIGGSVLGGLTGTGLGVTPTQSVSVTAPTTTPTATTPTSSVIGSVVPSVVAAPKVEVVDRPIKDTCPSPEMLITLSDGTKKKAGDLAVGDLVKTQHEHTLEWGVYPVVFKEIIPKAQRLKITFDGNEFIGSEDHKFFIAVDNWKKAKDLKPGDIVSGQTIKSIEQHTDGPVVFITIEDAHSYVCQDLLSHNKKPNEVVGSVVGSTSVNPLVAGGLLALGASTLAGGGSTVPAFDQAVFDAIINAGSPVYPRTNFTPMSGGTGMYQIAPTDVYNYFGLPYGAGRFGALVQPFTLPGLLGPNTGLLATPSRGASI